MTGPDDRGSSTVEAALLTPVVLVMSLIGIQAALYLHVHQVAQAAADEAVAAARLRGATGADADQAAHQLLGPARPLVHGVRVAVTTVDGRVSVVVTGQAARLLPLAPLGVSATATATIERFTPP